MLPELSKVPLLLLQIFRRFQLFIPIALFVWEVCSQDASKIFEDIIDALAKLNIENVSNVAGFKQGTTEVWP